MSPTALNTDLAAGLLAAQGVNATPQAAQTAAGFATTVLGNAAKAFAQLPFEAEPANYAAALGRNAP